MRRARKNKSHKTRTLQQVYADTAPFQTLVLLRRTDPPATAKFLIYAVSTPCCSQRIPRKFNELEEFSSAIRTVGLALQVGVLDV